VQQELFQLLAVGRREEMLSDLSGGRREETQVFMKAEALSLLVLKLSSIVELCRRPS